MPNARLTLPARSIAVASQAPHHPGPSPQLGDPSFRALLPLFDQVFAYHLDLPVDELGHYLEQAVRRHWSEQDRPGLVLAIRTLAEQLQQAAARLERPGGDTPASIDDLADDPFLPVRLCEVCLVMQQDMGARLQLRSDQG